ncbi:IS607 family transposase [Nonomuraea maritima]|uniref:IS607 family transposase n=1 Tax=Nonomuraea maritima TaxID=683260 RepID=UPI00371E19C8
MTLPAWAARHGVHYKTAWTWAKQGRMPVPVRQTLSGTWLVDELAPEASGRVVAYCRVSSADQRADLDRQVARVVQGATGLGLPVAEVVTEVGSGLTGRRGKLHRLLSDPSAAVIVVEHRDRLARFGVEQLEAVLSQSGRRLVALDLSETTDTSETTDDLVRDITEVLTSMCARLYGRRAAETRAARAVAVATGEAGE